MRRPAWVAELRTWWSGVDPGLTRLRLASIAVAAMVVAATVLSLLRWVGGYSVTVVLFGAVLAMVSNLSVNEPDPARRRVSTVLLALPGCLAVAAGTLLAPHRIPADVVFVLVMMAAVWARRFGPRGTALGMAAFMGYFFTQFLGATVAELPWLLLAVVVGVSATVLLRTWLFAERPERTLERLLRALRARVHALLRDVGELLTSEYDAGELERALRELGRSRARLNDTALLIADQLDRAADRDRPEHPVPGAGDRPAAGGVVGAGDEPDELTLLVLDAELAAERLAVATTRMLTAAVPVDRRSLAALAAGVRWLQTATGAGAATAVTAAARLGAEGAVSGLAHDADGAVPDRVQRVAFAVTRLAEALDRVTARVPEGATVPALAAEVPSQATRVEPTEEAGDGDHQDERDEAPPRRELALATRQSVQVGVATSLAIVVGELVSPARWYWAVITAFVVFAGTTSRGDLLNRGLLRLVGTVGGVVAGMGLAALVGDAQLPALVLMLGCVFLALYLVRVSQALMAFWITTVLALLYGLIGQFSAHTLLVRVEETAAGAALGIAAGFLILPKRTREVFAESLDAMVDKADEALDTAADRLAGRAGGRPPLTVAREMHAALGELRLRVRPLDNPLPGRRGRTSYHRALRVLTAVDHYGRSMARTSVLVADPDWAPTLLPVVDRVRANVRALRDRVLHRDPDGELVSAEELIDAAEEHAARAEPPARRHAELVVTRVVRRLDQVVVGFAADLGESAPHVPATVADGRKIR